MQNWLIIEEREIRLFIFKIIFKLYVSANCKLTQLYLYIPRKFQIFNAQCKNKKNINFLRLVQSTNKYFLNYKRFCRQIRIKSRFWAVKSYTGTVVNRTHYATNSGSLEITTFLKNNIFYFVNKLVYQKQICTNPSWNF